MSAAADVQLAVEDFSRVLGEPLSTPEWYDDGDGAMRRATYRVWYWPCPLCGAGFKPDVCCGIEVMGLTKPLTLDSEGNVRCHLCGAGVERIAIEIVELLEEKRSLDLLEGW